MAVTDREHRYLKVRRHQIHLNRLAAFGGRPYIEARLERAANESDLSWLGIDDEGNQVCRGRRDRASYVNDAARVCQKIEQYLFSQPIARDGADAGFLADVTGEGVGADAFMQQVCREITVAGWCWIQVDRQAWDTEAGQTVRQKLDAGDRVKWTLWDAESVVDWHMDDDGRLGWLLVAGEVWTDSDPMVDERRAIVRTLFRREHGGHVTMSEFLCDGEQPYELRHDFVLAGLDEIPFVCVGLPSPRPWWFDDVEAAQAQCLNLGSLHNETLVGSVFPQLVISETAMQSADVRLRADGKDKGESLRIVREKLRGRNHPLVESEGDKGVSRFIEPSGSGLKLIPEEQSRIRALMFENAGMSLFNRETRQVQTAESKQFDQLDTNSTLRHRAMMLQTAEKKLVELSVAFDSAFARYEPLYPSRFDVFDAQGMATAVQTVANMPSVTLSMRKMALVAGVRMLQGIATFDHDLVEKAMDEIDELQDAGGETGGEYTFVELPPTKYGDDEDGEEPDEPDAAQADDKKQGMLRRPAGRQ